MGYTTYLNWWVYRISAINSITAIYQVIENFQPLRESKQLGIRGDRFGVDLWRPKGTSKVWNDHRVDGVGVGWWGGKKAVFKT